jgi:muramoyltetrapeptide carboxypeptidase
LAGVLSCQNTVLWGDFGHPSILDYDRGYDLNSVIDYARNTLDLGERLITGLPFGHCPKKLSLPMGVQANLSLSTNQQVSLQYYI